MKICAKCKIEKEDTLFNKKGGSRKGLHPYCKSCMSEAGRQRTLTGRYRTPEYRERQKALGRTTYAARKDSLKAYELRNRDHVDARLAVRKAIKAGEMVKMPCVDCKEPVVEAHHHAGYDKENWLNITWLCKEHHRKAHHG